MKGWVMVAPNGIETDEALTVWLNKARDVTQTLPPKIVKVPAMTIPETLLDVRTHADAGYRPLVDFGAWRVAILNFNDDLRPENITAMQRHNETDEVFVLLRGRCILFVGEGDDHSIAVIHAQPMAPRTIYNVKKAVWHTHTISLDAMVLVVENRDTTYDNSPFCPLTAMQRKTICEMAADQGL